MYGYIYKTTNLINGKIYIGKHKGAFTENYLGSGRYINNAIIKYGKENFSVELIEYCDTIETQNKREVYWIDFYLSLGMSMYNISKGGDGGDTFYKLSESDRKIRIKNLSKNSYFANLTKEQSDSIRKKSWETRRKNGNDVFSDEHKKKLSEAHKGHKVTQAQIDKMISTRKFNGYKHSEATKLKISQSNKGKKHCLSKEGKRRLSEFNKHKSGVNNPFYGKTHSELTKNIIGSYNKERFKNRIWINNGQVNKRVLIDDLDIYKQNGFIEGRIKWRKA